MQQKTNYEMPTGTKGESLKDDSIRSVLPEDYQLNLSDFALFLSVMKVKKAYEDVLSIILDEPNLRLKEVKAEQVVLNKSGKKTRYKNLPSTIIIFITQDDIFGKDLARYTFSEQCEEVSNLPLEDGTKKIFLNMTSMNGRPELISLLQYMKNTTLDNPHIAVKDERILDLDKIVGEVKQSEEWEAVKMNILEIGIEKGIEQGIEKGIAQSREEIIQNMLMKGYTSEKVSELTLIPLNIVKEVEKNTLHS